MDLAPVVAKLDELVKAQDREIGGLKAQVATITLNRVPRNLRRRTAGARPCSFALRLPRKRAAEGGTLEGPYRRIRRGLRWRLCDREAPVSDFLRIFGPWGLVLATMAWLLQVMVSDKLKSIMTTLTELTEGQSNHNERIIANRDRDGAERLYGRRAYM